MHQHPNPTHLTHKRRQGGTIAAVVLLSIILGGGACPQPPPTDAIEDPNTLIQAVQGVTQDINSVRLKDMRLDYFGEKGRVSVRQLILIGKPDRLRIQTYIPGLEGVAGVLACSCGQFAYHDRQQNVYYYGPASAENVARVLPVGLTCSDLGSILLGGLPMERIHNEAGPPVLEWDQDTVRYRMTWPLNKGSSKGGTLTAQIRHGDWRVAEIQVHDAQKKLKYTYTGRAFERIEGTILPTNRRFLVADESADISMAGEFIELNPDLPDILWGLEAPGGTPLNYVGDKVPRPKPPANGDLCTSAP